MVYGVVTELRVGRGEARHTLPALVQRKKAENTAAHDLLGRDDIGNHFNYA